MELATNPAVTHTSITNSQQIRPLGDSVVSVDLILENELDVDSETVALTVLVQESDQTLKELRRAAFLRAIALLEHAIRALDEKPSKGSAR